MKKFILNLFLIFTIISCTAQDYIDWVVPSVGVVGCPVVGESYQGGRVAYIFVSGNPGYVEGECHGIIAATSDQAVKSVYWGCYGTPISGADGVAIGTGTQNTADIINPTTGCSESGIAALICSELNEGGFDDWVLPSKGELSYLYVNRIAIGNFQTSYYDSFYWTSSEASSTEAWIQIFNDGTQDVLMKAYNSPWDPKSSVRAIRYF